MASFFKPFIVKQIYDTKLGKPRDCTRWEIFTQWINHFKFQLFGEFRFVYWIIVLIALLWAGEIFIYSHFITKFW